MEGNDVDDHPTPVVELPQAHEYARSYYQIEVSFIDLGCKCDEHAIFYE